MKIKKNSLNFETLEDRRCHAVFASVSAGDLVINGDAANDQIQLTRQTNGAIRVQGLNGATVNGYSYVDRFFSDDLFINLGNGANAVTLGSANGGITADDVNITTGSGLDNIIIYKLTAKDDIVISAGAHNDYIYMNNVVARNLTADAGDNGISVYGKAGHDRLDMYNTSSAMDINVLMDDANSTGLWNDVINASNVSATDDIYLYDWGGNDKMNLRSMRAGDYLYAYLGEGNDYLYLVDSNSRINSLHGGGGRDTLRYYNDFANTWQHSGFETFLNGY